MTTSSGRNGNERFPIDKAREWLVGPMVAVATPFKEDFSLDLDALRDNVRFMINRGVRTGNGTLLVGGAGGEHPAMNADERKTVMDVAMEAADGEVPVLTSVQHTDTRVTIDLAQHAAAAGLQGVQLGPTYYYVPTEGDVSRLFDLVASESDVMLMIYHTHWDGLTMSMGLLRELADMPTVGALKWSAPTSDLYEEGLVEFSGKLSVIDNGGRHVLSHQLGAAGLHHAPERFLARVHGGHLAAARGSGLRRRRAPAGEFQIPMVGVADAGRRSHRWRGAVHQGGHGRGRTASGASEAPILQGA